MLARIPAIRCLAPALALTLLLGACDDESLQPVPAPGDATAGAMFNSYVAIGNSITAGFQSGGINDSTQRQSYAYLLARQMGSTFNAPLLNAPGCPAPFINIFTQERLSDLVPCALRSRPLPDVIHNVAVPGAAAIDPLSNLAPTSSGNTLTALFLGGRTQLEAAADAQPTFVTVFIGNNDALGSVTRPDNLAGDPATYTSVADFADLYDELEDELDDLGAMGGVLIGVVQVGSAPYVTQGRAYAAAAAAIPTLTVDANCLSFIEIPGTTDTVWASVPFHYGGPLIAQASAGTPTTLDCSVGEVITAPEMLGLVTTVAQYNGIIAAAAANLGWVFVDPNDLLLQLAAQPGAIRPFPAFDPSDPQHASAPFGTALSLDGLHPSASTHRMVANALIQAINAAYSTSIPALN